MAEEACAFRLEHSAVVKVESDGSPFDAGCLCRCCDAVNGVEDDGMLKLAGDASEDAEVAWTEHEDVDAGNFGDGLNVFECLGDSI